MVETQLEAKPEVINELITEEKPKEEVTVEDKPGPSVPRQNGDQVSILKIG